MVKLSVEKALPLSLIVNELISNSMKHAFQNANTGKIEIVLTTDQDNIKLEYRDSGSQTSWLEQAGTEGIGLKLIDLLTSQLKGIQDNSKAGSFRLIIPRK